MQGSTKGISGLGAVYSIVGMKGLYLFTMYKSNNPLLDIMTYVIYVCFAI